MAPVPFFELTGVATVACRAADPLHGIATHDHRGGALSDYERQRLANIAGNQRRLQQLGLA